MTGVPPYGTGPHEDYLTWQGEQRATGSPGTPCRACDGSGTLTVPDADGEGASEQACPAPGCADHARWLAWAEGESYDESFDFSLEDMAGAFKAGMRAQRGLSVWDRPRVSFGSAGGPPRLRLSLCGDHPGQVHAQVLDHPAPGLDAWVCLRQLADVAEGDASEITAQPAPARLALGENPSDNLAEAERAEDGRPSDAAISAWIENYPREFVTWLETQRSIGGVVPRDGLPS